MCLYTRTCIRVCVWADMEGSARHRVHSPWQSSWLCPIGAASGVAPAAAAISTCHVHIFPLPLPVVNISHTSLSSPNDYSLFCSNTHKHTLHILTRACLLVLSHQPRAPCLVKPGYPSRSGGDTCPHLSEAGPDPSRQNVTVACYRYPFIILSSSLV